MDKADIRNSNTCYPHPLKQAIAREDLWNAFYWITKDGVIVATGTNWPAEIRIYMSWGNEAVLQGAVAHELLECGTGPFRNHINVVAVVLDNVKLGPVITYELLAELGRNGFAGKAYRMSDGDEEIRAGLADYLLPDAAAA
jgi:hypothetical protein